MALSVREKRTKFVPSYQFRFESLPRSFVQNRNRRMFYKVVVQHLVISYALVRNGLTQTVDIHYTYVKDTAPITSNRSYIGDKVKKLFQYHLCCLINNRFRKRVTVIVRYCRKIFLSAY